MAFSGVMRDASRKLHYAGSWVELWEVRVDSGSNFLCAACTTAIVFNGKTYVPYWIERSDDERDVQGTIPSLNVTVGNLDAVVSTELEKGSLIGQVAIRTLVNTALIGDPSSFVEDRYTILDAEVQPFAVVFRVGLANPLELGFPLRRFQRNRCDLAYGGPLCRYDTNRPGGGAIATCDRTLLGANGCKVHGDDEVAAGIPRHHTLNYGGCPSMARGPFNR